MRFSGCTLGKHFQQSARKKHAATAYNRAFSQNQLLAPVSDRPCAVCGRSGTVGSTGGGVIMIIADLIFEDHPTPKILSGAPKFSLPSDTHPPLKTAGMRGFWPRYARLETTHPPKVGQQQLGSTPTHTPADSEVCYHNYTAPANEQGPGPSRIEE